MSQSTTVTGQLTLVAAPIGNLGDMTSRAIETLKTADTIACEDTRVTGKLLSKLGIDKTSPLLSYREENEKHMAIELAGRIELGERIALISDAGMPVISDPGFRLVRECRKRGLRVTSAPGLTAATTALALSGLPTDAFLYVGFLPPKSAARKRFIESKKEFEYTIIVYESCHRIGKFLDELIEILGKDRHISVSRELTKLHETVHTGLASKVRECVKNSSQKGEFVICIAKQGFVL
ncbi:MAG: 16S rRNA (cytidine(1402)-2'-O)-methyltransferase [Verrucomicrobiota bacterium]|nr:16S rRNA (cytidine(1402)-2'-O)-methyltransferase [Verrucomicrobiota bacterium]